jgi:hypothetical protein
MEKEEIINLIKGRIEVECRKHGTLDWPRIAAGKIYTEWFEYFDNENQELKDKISQLEKDVEYWQGEFDHWHKQAMEMADELKKLKEIINGSL